MTKSEKAEKATKAIARLTKKGAALSPISEFSGMISQIERGKAFLKDGWRKILDEMKQVTFIW